MQKLILTGLAVMVQQTQARPSKLWTLFPNFELVPEPIIEVIEEGDGEFITRGSKVSVHFEMFDEKGEKIMSTRDDEAPMEMEAGVGWINL